MPDALFALAETLGEAIKEIQQDAIRRAVGA